MMREKNGMYSSVTLNTFTLLCSHYQHPSPELFHLSQLKLCPLNYNSSLLLWKCLEELSPVEIGA
ncbi:unnamed protein product [Nyctereutes procyonoides]|uniref:(raccoon dog) hypothetical protein n=1 Tax=Nyctereutes procyonoides TaxID=34880 RepID=A0A811Y332_NYCPR|nr:unnamed protein product [Nyctereutes procyonoides]